MKVASIIACAPLLAGTLLAQSTNGRLPGEGGQGVTVKLLPPSPQTHEPLRYVLSEPAYVAAFIVYPGAGVRLLYPTVNVPERIRRSGYNTDQLIGASFDNDSYRVVLGPGTTGPAYLYLIASRNPLDVARYVHKPMALASAVGENESRSFYNDVAFDALLNNAVALGDDTSWDSDVYMFWPHSESSTRLADAITPDGMPNSLYTYMLCSDGTTRYVPVNYPFTGCPGQLRIRPSNAASRQVRQLVSAQHTGAAEVVTVLPSIIGPRMTDAQRRAAIQQERASQQAMYTTVANGDQQAESRQEAAASPTELQVIGIGPRGGDARGERDALHGEYSPEQRGRFSGRAGAAQQSGEVGGSPQLPPNPRLAPNPGMSPAPGMQREESRPARSHRDFEGGGQRQEERGAHRDMPRSEAPRMTSPAAVRSQGTASESSSGRGQGRVQP